jgi:hypothetical protein
MQAVAALHVRYSIAPDRSNRTVRALREAYVHERIFMSRWLEAICGDGETADVRSYVSRLFGEGEEGGATLCMIHGALDDWSHILLSRTSPRSNALLVDWKCSGIGPREIDLVLFFAGLDSAQRADLLFPMVSAYCDGIRAAGGASVNALDLVREMRDAARALSVSGPFEWNRFGAMCSVLSRVCDELTEVVQ